MIYRLLISGSPTFDNYDLLRSATDSFIQSEMTRLEMTGFDIDGIEFISDKEPGSALLGWQYAREEGKEPKVFRLNYDRYGKLARLIINDKMIEYAASGDVRGGCIVFWDGEDPATGNLVHTAFKWKLNMRVIIY